MRKNSLILNPSSEQIPNESFALVLDYYDKLSPSDNTLVINGTRMDTKEYVRVCLEPTLFNTESPRVEHFMKGETYQQESLLVKTGGIIHVHKAKRTEQDSLIPLYRANWLSKVAQNPPELSYESNGHLNHSLALPFLGSVTQVLHEDGKKTAFARFVLDDTAPGQFEYIRRLDGMLAQGLAVNGHVGTLRLSKDTSTLKDVTAFTQAAILHGKGLVVRIVNQDGSVKSTLIEPIATELSLRNAPQPEAVEELLHHLRLYLLANERQAEGQTIELMPVHTFNFGKKATQRLQQERMQHYLGVLNPVDETLPFLAKGVLSARNYLQFDLASQSLFITDVGLSRITLDNVWAHQCQQLAILPPSVWNPKNFKTNQQVGLALECLIPVLVYTAQKSDFDLDQMALLLEADHVLTLKMQDRTNLPEGYVQLLERLDLYIEALLKNRPDNLSPEQETEYIKALHTALKPYILKNLVASGGLQLKNAFIMRLIPTPEQLAHYTADLCVEPYSEGFEIPSFEEQLEQDFQKELQAQPPIEIPAATFEYDNSEQNFRAHSFVQIETVVENTASCPIISIETQSGKLLHGKDNLVVEASAYQSEIAHKRELVVEPKAYQSFTPVAAATPKPAAPEAAPKPAPKPASKPHPDAIKPAASPFVPPTPYNTHR